MRAPLAPSASVAFVGLGRMGFPMAGHLAAAGFAVRGFDVSADARERLAALDGAAAFATASEAADGADAIILMVPDSGVVESVLVGGGLLEALPRDALVIDMSSSEPLRTRALAERAAGLGVELVDAPVSGGVAGAQAATLTIMAGGPGETVAACRPLFEVVGATVVHAGPVGAGHALKSLNNLLSATTFLATCEALEIGRGFGLDPQTMLDAINVSTGRSLATERKWPDQVLTERYASGFALALMAKDMRIAIGLARQLGAEHALGAEALSVWERAQRALPADADQTEVGRWVRAESGGG
ncbi:NAD(P)-dependent oxidoreductase [Capillimicrobium parvum]|uniref:2-(Hydroxymethyl)glutarate dehydrogenase n=1 Tax=Capillimicrobium parvum TaxID=2884022 RepID=A0A9E7BZM3_9ACTN|nr:NAD(P)-dependent oxidoreductase [Capillimicrobium parvum]UGS35535.1 2-(hydroxymethyl)glutarate dehydrogenase [Capillimicrobium parvum]